MCYKIVEIHSLGEGRWKASLINLSRITSIVVQLSPHCRNQAAATVTDGPQEAIGVSFVLEKDHRTPLRLWEKDDILSIYL